MKVCLQTQGIFSCILQSLSFLPPYFSGQPEYLFRKISPATDSLTGSVINSIFVGRKEQMNGSCQLCGRCGIPHLVIHHTYLVIFLGKCQHGLYKILALTVEPGSPYHKESVRKTAYKFFTLQLGSTICTLR